MIFLPFVNLDFGLGFPECISKLIFRRKKVEEEKKKT